jgi:hypothetical protein
MQFKVKKASRVHMFGVPLTVGTAVTFLPWLLLYTEPYFALLRIASYFA